MEKIKRQNAERVHDFVTWFQREYLKRREKNPMYSIRAFSNYLGLASGTVSHLLSGRRRPSQQFVSQLFPLLEVTPHERELVLKSLKKKNQDDSAVPEKDQHYRLLAMDSFKLIADWYHYALIELTAVKDFRYDVSWIANSLDISPVEVKQAVERLLRLDLLIEKDGTLVRTELFLTNGDDETTNSALRKLQTHVLEKALLAIQTVPLEEKDISSITMAIDTKKIPEAKKRITKFRREMARFLEHGEQTRVYNLGIQLYPISKARK